MATSREQPPETRRQASVWNHCPVISNHVFSSDCARQSAGYRLCLVLCWCCVGRNRCDQPVKERPDGRPVLRSGSHDDWSVQKHLHSSDESLEGGDLHVVIIRCLVTVVAVCLFGMSANALKMEDCRAQYKADMAPKGASRIGSWHDYQVKRCGIDPNASAPTPKYSAPIKH
jgi:hypothetical protein